MPDDRIFIRELLSRHLLDAGFFSVAFLDRESFADVMDDCKVEIHTRAKYSLHEAASAVVVALRYSEGLFEMPDWAGSAGSGTMLEIGRFARANWYAELKQRLKKSVDAVIAEAGAAGIILPPSARWQRLVNSGLPEKALAERSGAGRIGMNRILIADAAQAFAKIRHSSAVVLGILLCPVDIGAEPANTPAGLCGNCSRCIDACPTKALGSRKAPSYSRLDCIQHWTSTEGILPENVGKTFGSRLYGCDICLEACPHFRVDPEAATSLGRLGPGLPAEYLLAASDDRIRKDFAGTALDRAWMSMAAFRRNARLAAGEKNGH